MLKAVSESGMLRITNLGAEFSVPFSQLTPGEKKNLALTILTEGDPEAHALAAHYLMAVGQNQAAERHLSKARASRIRTKVK